MEAGILRKMVAAQKPDGPSDPSNNRGPILVGILLLLLLIPMYCTLIADTAAVDESGVANSPEQSPAPGSGATQDIAPTGMAPLSPAETSEPPPNAGPGLDTRETEQPTDEQRRAATGSDQDTPTPGRSSSSPRGANISVETTIDKIAIADRARQEKEVAPSLTELPIPDAAIASGPSLRFGLSNDSASFRPVPPLPRKIRFASSVGKAPKVPLLQPLTLVRAQAAEPPARAPRRLSLLAGVADWRMGHGTDHPARADFESPLLSWQGGITYLHPLPNQFTVLTGLEWRRLESRLDWSTSLDDYQITLQDTILLVETNILTGRESKIRGDVTLTVPANRVVRHHNHTQLIQIPLAVGKTWLYRNWQADLLIGGAFTVYTQHRGRTLYRGEIRDYAGSTTDFIDNRWQFSARLAGRLSYRINRRLGITTGIQWQRSLGNWSTESNIIQRPSLWGVQFGITYSTP